MKKNISIFSTHIGSTAKQRISKVLDSTFVSEGSCVKEFEKKLLTDFGIRGPVAVNSGTSALHLSLILAGIREGDEVICPPQSFVASGMVILQMKAKPVFADIVYECGNIDPVSVEKKITNKTKAIIAVHWGGYPCEMDALLKIAHKYKLILIEDAAHAFGATYKNKDIGSISDYTCFSFQAIKHLTTGDGGLIACKNPHNEKIAKKLRWFGIDRDSTKSSPPIIGGRLWDIKLVGFKYHMNDYSAALGLANIEGIRERLVYRKKLAAVYTKELSNIAGIKLFTYHKDRKSAYWLFGMHVEKREAFAKAMKSKGITVSVVDKRIDANSVFGGVTPNLFNQEKFDETQIHIPIHEKLSSKDITFIIKSIKEGW